MDRASPISTIPTTLVDIITVNLILSRRIFCLSVTRDMSGFVAHDLSGLLRSPMEVTDEADRGATGDPGDAI